MKLRFLALSVLLVFPMVALGAEKPSVRVLPLPARSSIALGAQRVDMLLLEFTASCDADLTIRQITVEHRGKGALSDIARVYIMAGNRRVSRARSFSSKDPRLTIDLRGWTVNACKTQTLHIVMDVSSTASASGEHQLILDSLKDIETENGTLQGSLGAMGGSTRTVAPDTQGTVSVEYLSVQSPIYYGANRTVARMRLRATSKDAAISSIMLTNQGSARDSDLQNLFLQTSGGRLQSAKTKQLDERTVTLTFDDPLILERNKEVVLSLQADVRGRASRSIRMTVEEPGDVLLEPVTVRRLR